MDQVLDFNRLLSALEQEQEHFTLLSIDYFITFPKLESLNLANKNARHTVNSEVQISRE